MKRSEIAISASLVPIDYLAVILAGIASYYSRYWEPIKAIRPIVFNLPFGQFLGYLWLIGLIWIICFALAGLYSMDSTRRTIDEISKIILGCSTAVMILMFVFFFSRNLFESRYIIILGWILSIIFILIGRGLVRSFQHWLYRFNIGAHRMIIIGETQTADEAAKAFAQNSKSGHKVVDRYPDFDENVESKLYELHQQDKFDEILVADAWAREEAKRCRQSLPTSKTPSR